MNGNTGLFAPWVEKNNNLNLVPRIKDFEITQSMVTAKSAYSENTPRLRKAVVSAICKIADINLDMSMGGLGTFIHQGEKGYAVEIVEGGIRQVAVIHKDKLYAAKSKNGTLSSYKFKEGYDTGVLLFVALLYYEMFQKNQEIIDNMANAQKLLKAGLTNDNIQEFVNNCAVISENLYRRLCKTPPEITVNLLNNTGSINVLTKIAVDSRKYKPTKVDKGAFQILGNATLPFENPDPHVAAITGDDVQPEKEEVKPPAAEQPATEGRTFSGRVLTEEEQRLVPKIEPWYIMPREVMEISTLIKKTSGTFKPKRNFLLRGPSSTGKTSMARAIAAELGLPYVFMTCCTDTESYDFLGQPMYDYEGNIKYVESNFIKAIKYGWLVEIQEPLTIAKQGVLTILNGLMDDSNGITLSNGEFVKRHPDCVVILTTNVSYVGCKKPNQSVLRRMNNVYDIGMPSNDDICARVKSVTKFNNDGIIKKMVDVCGKINQFCREEAIDDGVCGVSEIIDWIMTLQVTGDILGAAESTIVSKATDDESAQNHIRGYVESTFASIEYETVDESLEDTVLRF